MSENTFVRDTVTAPIPVREALSCALFGVLLLLTIYFVGAEEGATSIFSRNVCA